MDLKLHSLIKGLSFLEFTVFIRFAVGVQPLHLETYSWPFTYHPSHMTKKCSVLLQELFAFQSGNESRLKRFSQHVMGKN